MTIAHLSGQVTLQERILIDQFELKIVRGWTCLLGPSGCGKSTLLRLIAGLDTQAVFTGTRKVAGRVGWMAQSDLLQPRLSVLENVRLMHHLRGLSKSAAEVNELLNKVGLAGFSARLPDELSGGQRQRVALARVLADDAPLVLLDEPFSALDPITRVDMQALAYHCLKDRAVLMVTHDPGEALRLSNRIVQLSDGQLNDEPALPGPHPLSVDDPALSIASGEFLSRLAGRA